MSSENTRFDWRIVYGIFCIIFAAWIVYLALDNFDKVHGEYHQAVVRLQPQQIEKIAFQLLADQCRSKLKRRGQYKTNDKNRKRKEGPCLSFTDAEIEERKKVVKKHLQIEKKQFLRKLIVFYISFAVFFLILPLFLLYLLLSFLIWIFRDIKIHK